MRIYVGADWQACNNANVTSQDERTKQLEVLLDSALHSFAAWLVAAGCPATRSEQRTWITQAGNGELVSIEASTAWMYLGSWQSGLAGAWTSEALAFAGELAKRTSTCRSGAVAALMHHNRSWVLMHFKATSMTTPAGGSLRRSSSRRLSTTSALLRTSESQMQRCEMKSRPA